ncbi:hypothetical protein [Candidatus Phytoplasma melaleucae]|uniref:Protein-export membrane protein SecG n=1 Tax=Candidatus Phytoplasma melaleucae TaxID=2982630 RepID=A0ABT9DDU4_9MOLU|nr:hypothetical protein ['Melaleuca sp.' phytoplasma]MDO8168198.1 hypothetical protein ['Melaleuca sp.' phytoplasma]
MMILPLKLPNFMLYVICIAIIITVLLSSEKNITDMFAEQYGIQRINSSETRLNRFISVLVFFLFAHSFLQQNVI